MSPPDWARECTTPGLLVPHQFPDYKSPTLEDVRRGYAALTEGQNPTHLRNLKFLHCNKHPGGKEIDFIDQMLILEYSNDKQMVKEKVANDLFEALLSETVTVMKNIPAKKASRDLRKCNIMLFSFQSDSSFHFLNKSADSFLHLKFCSSKFCTLYVVILL